MKPEEKPFISLKDFQEAFELKARQYDIELPNRGYDIHAMCKELYSLLIKQKLAWSEEDERMCQETIDWFEKKCFPYALESENPARESIKWLKSLKNIVIPQPKQEWSEEDSLMSRKLIDTLEGRIATWEGWQVPYVAWLKSLKDKVQPKWKPSDKQMNA